MFRSFVLFLLAIGLIGCASTPKHYPDVPLTQKNEVLSLLQAGKVEEAFNKWDALYAVLENEDNEKGLAEMELIKGQFMILDVKPGDSKYKYKQAVALLESSAERYEDLDMGYHSARALYALIQIHIRGNNMRDGCAYLEPAISVVEDATDLPQDFLYPTGGLSPHAFLVSLRSKCDVATFEPPKHAYDDSGRLRLFERKVKPSATE